MPRIAVMSDIHGNIEALKVVIKRLEKENPDEWICLGDLVGYGPRPTECIEMIRAKDMKTVSGNHDAGAAGKFSLNNFRNPNRRLLEISRELLSHEQLTWLRGLPYTIEGKEWVAAHATPDKPMEWSYLTSAFQARDLLKNQKKHLILVGHTHRPGIVSESFGITKYQKEGKFLINPGSVGQSRDGDYRASCCLIDTEIAEYKNFRLDYDTEPVLTELMKLGFSREDTKRLMRF